MVRIRVYFSLVSNFAWNTSDSRPLKLFPQGYVDSSCKVWTVFRNQSMGLTKMACLPRSENSYHQPVLFVSFTILSRIGRLDLFQSLVFILCHYWLRLLPFEAEERFAAVLKSALGQVQPRREKKKTRTALVLLERMSASAVFSAIRRLNLEF